MTDSKAEIIGQVRANAEAWRDWLVLLLDKANQVRAHFSLCEEAVCGPLRAAGFPGSEARRYGIHGEEIPVDVPDINAAHYTAEGLRALFLQPASERRAEAKEAVRQFAIAHLSEVEGEYIESVFCELGFDMPRRQARIDISGVYFSWRQPAGGGERDPDAHEIEGSVLGALRGLMPEGAAECADGDGFNGFDAEAEVSITWMDV